MEKIVILGAGGLAREVYWHMQGSQYTDFIFVDDITDITEMRLKDSIYPVVKNWDFTLFDVKKFIVGIGSPKAKKIMVEKAILSGLTPAETYIHPKSLVQDARLGVGGIVAPNCIVTTNVSIGNYVVLNLSCTVGHDAFLDDWVTVNPGAHISGNVRVGKGVTLGTGTAIREEILIAEGAVTGAQTAVVSNLQASGIYVGVPAKLLKPTL